MFVRCLESDMVCIMGVIPQSFRSGVQPIITTAVVEIGGVAALDREGMDTARKPDRRAVVPATHRKSHGTLPAQRASNDKRRRGRRENWNGEYVSCWGIGCQKNQKICKEILLCKM